MEFRRVLFRSVERRDLIAPRQCPWPLPARQPYRRFRGNAVRKQEMHAFSPEIDGNAIKALQHIHAQQQRRSEEHTSELQSLMRISYAVLCLKKKNTYHIQYLIRN